MSIIKNFIKNESGVIALVFALSVPLIIGSVGIGVDMSKAYHTKNKLEKTLDAAALAAASTNYTKTSSPTIDEFVEGYVRQNFKDTAYSDIDLSSIVVQHDPDNKEVIVDGVAKSTNSFMSFFNRDYINVAARAVAKEKLTGVEVVLVLDDSDSMGTGSPSRAKELRDAAKNFIDVLNTSREETGGRVKIGIVPYGVNVNLGPYGLGRTPDNKIYDGGHAFVNNPNSRKYTDNRSQKDILGKDDNTPNKFDWGGCVRESNFYDTGNHSPAPPDTKWPMAFTCHDDTESRILDAGITDKWKTDCWIERTKQINKKVVSGSYTCHKREDVPWSKDIYVDGVYVRTDSGTHKNRCVHATDTRKWDWDWGDKYYNPITVNRYCPKPMVRPMLDIEDKSNRDELEKAINSLKGTSGDTQSDLGMAWANHLISPDRPFTEGSSFGSSDWTKVIVFMTDGKIRSHAKRGPYYLRDFNDGNDRRKRSEELFESECKKAASRGVLIYTVEFGDDMTSAEAARLKKCSGADRALKASEGKLKEVFETIAEDLGTIFLAR